MQKRALACLLAATAAVLMTAEAASASTFALGSIAQPSGSTANACIPTGLFAQSSGVAPALYTLPTGGQITQWQTNTAGATPGTPITLVALAPTAGLFKIEAVDPETVPNPAGSVATFTPASPLMASAGDVLGIVGDAGATCAWVGGSTPLTSVTNLIGVFNSTGLVTLSPGEVSKSLGTGPLAVNLAATLVSSEDSAVTTTVTPGTITGGAIALLASTVTNKGPATNPLTFTDVVPGGLKIVTVLSPSATCSTLGNSVTCTIPSLAAGQSTPIDIITTASPGTYTNAVRLIQSSLVTDPATTNNAASAKFTVAKAGSTRCVVTSLANVPLGTAKKLLPALGCKVGKVTKSSSSKVAKGSVIKTTPGRGSYAAGKSIAIVESSGPKKH
jgi:hypothetical protein